MYYFYIDKVLFPVTPAKFNIKTKNQNKTLTLINEGEVNLLKSAGLSEIDVDELILPLYQKYPFAVYENGFLSADYFLGKLESWKHDKQPHTCILSRVSPNGATLLFDTNLQVSIEDYEIREDVEKYGMDIVVKLSMKQYVSWGAKDLVIQKSQSSTGKSKVSKKKTRKTTKTAAKTYEVKKGDTLIGIARKQLGNESKYTKIYSLNKNTIEKAAKSHGRKSSSNGHWIYPGTRLKLPS